MPEEVCCTWKGHLHNPSLGVGYFGISSHSVGPTGRHGRRSLLNRNKLHINTLESERLEVALEETTNYTAIE
jgi:hypothetical protein